MSPQNVCPSRGIVTLVTFVPLFSTVCFQMFSQIACLRRGMVVLSAVNYGALLKHFKENVDPNMGKQLKIFGKIVFLFFWQNDTTLHGEMHQTVGEMKQFVGEMQ